jgi:hypothetical protein
MEHLAPADPVPATTYTQKIGHVFQSMEREANHAPRQRPETPDCAAGRRLRARIDARRKSLKPTQPLK